MSRLSLSPVLVTDGCGCIGSHIVSDILKDEPNADIFVLDLGQHNQVPGVTCYKCDISSLPEIEAIFARCKSKTVLDVASPDGTL